MHMHIFKIHTVVKHFKLLTICFTQEAILSNIITKHKTVCVCEWCVAKFMESMYATEEEEEEVSFFAYNWVCLLV